MKKLAALLLSAVMAAGLLAGCSGPAASSPPPAGSKPVESAPGNTEGYVYQTIKLDWGTTSSEGTIVVDSMQEFADKIKEATGGNVTIELHPGGVLGSVNAMMEQTQLGTLAMTNVQPSHLADIGVTDMNVLVMPYLFTSFDQRWNVIYGEIGRELLDSVDTAGNTHLHGFSYFGDGARHFYTTFPVHSVADIAGHKIRVQDTALDNAWASALGCIVTPTSSSEMYSAMDTGLVEGCEQPIANYYASKYYEVSDYFILDGHTYNTITIVFSQKIWDSLDPELQTLMEKTWNEIIQSKKSVITDTEKEYLDLIRKEGVEVIELDDASDWAAAMSGVYDQFGADFQGYIQRIQAVS